MIRSTLKIPAFIAVTLLLLQGCASLVTVEKVGIGQAGLEITSPSGEYLYGDTVDQLVTNTVGLDCFKLSKTFKGISNTPKDFHLNHVTSPSNAAKALTIGGQKVSVTTPFGDEAFEGVIALCQVPETNMAWVYSGASLRRHKLVVTEEQYRSARNGDIAVAYDTYLGQAERRSGGSFEDSQQILPSWVLWFGKDIY